MDGFLGGLGNIFHSIGSFFTGGGNTNQPQAPQNQQQNQPQGSVSNTNIVQPQIVQPQQLQPQPQPQLPANTVDANSLAQAATLQKPQSSGFHANLLPNRFVQMPQSGVAPSSLPAPQAPNTFDRVINTGADIAARTGIGLVQGVANLPDLITGGGPNRVSRGLAQSGKEVEQDQLTNGYNPTIRVDGEPVNLGNAIYKGAQVGLNAGMLAEPVAKLPDLIKAVPGMIKNLPAAIQGAGDAVDHFIGATTDVRDPAGNLVKAPNEVAVGVGSANPNQASDAVDQIAAKQAQAAANQPPIESATSTAPDVSPASQPDQPALPASPVSPATTPLAVSPLSPTEPPLATAPLPPPQSPLPVSPNPTEVLQAAASPETPTGAAGPELHTLQPAENVSSSNNVSQTSNVVNPPADRVALNAPEYRAGLDKRLGLVSKSLEDSSNVHEVLSNPELTAAGKAVTDTMTDEQLVNQYSRPVKLGEPGDAAVANNALDRLSEMYGKTSGAAQDQVMAAIKNIIDAGGEAQSEAGRVMNYGQEMLSHLPRPAKIAYYMRSIDALNVAAKADEASLLSENPAKANVVEAELNKYFTQDENLQKSIANADETLHKGDNPDDHGSVTKQELVDAYNAKQQLALDRQKNTGNMTDYLKTLLPKNKSLAQKVGDFQRTAMLSSPTGRVSALGGTGYTTLDTAVKQGVSGVMGTVHNAFSAPEKAVADTGMDARSLVKGFGRGLQKIWGTAHGQTYMDNPDTIMNISKGPRNTLSELSKSSSGNPLSRIVKAAASAHQNLTAGVEDSELVRNARAAGLRQGLSGDSLDKYTISHAANPTAADSVKAKLLHDTMNNLNNNPLTDALSKASGVLEKIPRIGPSVKNAILPFSHWLGGNIWNTVTDRNVLAAAYKTVEAALKGDTQGVIDNLAKFGVEGGKTYALGWVLSQHGILTNKDAAGNDYNGVYLHIGDKYIPVTTLGAFAPSIILGNAVYNAFHGPQAPGKNFIQHMSDTILGTLSSAYKAFSGQDILGGGSTIPAVNQALGSKASGWGQLVKAGANIVHQFIPAATGDINSVLNNGLQVGGKGIPAFHNPTHEAAQTSVINPNSASGTAKDPIKSAAASLINSIPIASQLGLPRNTGVAAQDLFDRVSKGDRASTTETQNLARANAPGSPEKIKIQLAADKKAFTASNKTMDTINGKTYINYNGKVSSYSTPLQAQQALDNAKYQSGELKDFGTNVNGKVYQQGSDGKVSSMDTKDYDYKNANDSMATAKVNNDLPGYVKGSQALLGNIGWQLKNATLTDSQRTALINKATTIQKDVAKYQGYGGFTKGSSGASAAAKLVKSNIIGALPSLARENFLQNLSAKPIRVNIPQVKLTAPDGLIKAHAISVRSSHGNYN